MRPTITADRNARIYQEFKAGTRQAMLAAKYGLSVIRVAQIVALERAKEAMKAEAI